MALPHRLAAAAIAVALLVACGRSSETVDVAAMPGAGLPVPYLLGDELVGPEETLRVFIASTPSGAFSGDLSPVALAEPGGDRVIYRALVYERPMDWERSFSEQGFSPGDPIGFPALRLVDADQRPVDQILIEGGESAAWRTDGRFAYTQADPLVWRVDAPYTAHVWVAQDLDAAPVRWTNTPDYWTVTAWAGDSLLLHHHGGEGEDLSVWVADGPGQLRLLGPGAIVAVSPDGRLVLVSDDSPDADFPPTTLYDVATGEEVATVDGEASPQVSAFGSDGDWLDDRIIVGSTTPDGAALTELLVGGSTIRIGRTVPLPLFPIGADEPVHLPGSSDGVIFNTWQETPTGTVTLVVTCDLARQLCTPIDEVATGRVWALRNPSAPRQDEEGGR